MINLFQPSANIKVALKNYEEVLSSGWYGRGKVVSEFEEKIADFLNIEPDSVHCVSSCTSAIFGICEALELCCDDTIIISTNSFPCIPSAIKTTGASLVVLDTEKYSGKIDLRKLAKAVSENKPTALFLTDYGGDPVDSEAVREIIGHDCMLLIDAATSFGTKFNHSNKYIHASADFVCYSFDAMKLITTGEGGAAVVQNRNLMIKFKEYCYLGLPTKQKSGLDVAKENSIAGWWEYDLNCFGKRAVMSDLAASLGLSEIISLNHRLARKAEIFNIYRSGLRELKNISIVTCDYKKYSSSNYFFTILADKRSELARYLLDNKVYTSFRYWPIHKMSLFKDDACGEFENSNSFANSALNLPIHCALTNEDVDFIIKKIIKFYEY